MLPSSLTTNHKGRRIKNETNTRTSRLFPWLANVLIGLLILQMFGCMSVPEGTPAMKQQALSFTPPPGKASVYIIRPYRFTGSAGLFNVSLDYQEFGSLETSSYLFGVVTPGEHVLRMPHALGVRAPFTAEVGRNYFFTVMQRLTGYHLDQTTEADGQAYVRKFKLSGDSRFEYQGKTEQTQ